MPSVAHCLLSFIRLIPAILLLAACQATSMSMVFPPSSGVQTEEMEATPATVSTATPTQEVPKPTLRIPSNIPTYTGKTLTMPVIFTRNGHSIISTVFSVDFDQTCLAFDSTDSDQDGIPDAVMFYLPDEFEGSVTFGAGDSDGEFDFFIGDTFPPLSALPDGWLASISFRATCLPTPDTTIIAPVGFSDDPSASFGNEDGQSVPGTTFDGSVEILPGIPGDANGDQLVDAGDISALVLEIFDGDGTDPADTPGGSFLGNPGGCDANLDGVVDAGDISCCVLRVFDVPGACDGGVTQAPDMSAPAGSAVPSGMPTELSRESLAWPPTRHRGRMTLVAGPTLAVPEHVRALPGSDVTLPISFTANGHDVSGLIFSLDYDETWLTFDPADADQDGIPDAVGLYLPDEFDLSATFDESDDDGELDFFLADLTPRLASLPDGTLVRITLKVGYPQGTTEAPVAFSPDPPASFGSTEGQSVPGTTASGSVVISPLRPGMTYIYLPLSMKVP